MQDYENKDMEESLEYLSIFTKRLYSLLQSVQSKDINLIDKIVIFNFISEIAYNIYTETLNITNLITVKVMRVTKKLKFA